MRNKITARIPIIIEGINIDLFLPFFVISDTPIFHNKEFGPESFSQLIVSFYRIRIFKVLALSLNPEKFKNYTYILT